MAIMEQTLWFLDESERESVERSLRRCVSAHVRRLEHERSHREAMCREQILSDSMRAYRDKYCAGKSKSARKRVRRKDVCNTPEYLEIERHFASVYLKAGVAGNVVDVKGLSFAELVSYCHDNCPPKDSTKAVQVLLGAAKDCMTDNASGFDCEAFSQRLRRDVLEMCRTKALGKYGRIYLDGTNRGWGRESRAFSLRGICGMRELKCRVRKSRIVERMVNELVTGDLGSDARRCCGSVLIADGLIDLDYPTLRGIRDALVSFGVRDADSLVRRRADRVLSADVLESVFAFESSSEFEDEVCAALLQNKRYRNQYEAARRELESVLAVVPGNPVDEYPSARRMSRHFVVHVGPTNSGKTHDAMADLMRADSGVYLGPLRLLAYEAYCLMNERGCACSLVTGEEAVEVSCARHVASTVEMLDFDARYECAVIDEAQLIGDADRGYAWSAAILGVRADTVHVCCAPEAVDLVKELVGLCDDTVEVVSHERLVPLEPFGFGKNVYRFPQSVERGDALVVFSRRSVHAVASYLKRRGISVAMIYGALPHTVRQSEARRFADGEADVVVTTDAIGMGMNLPIRRVVFLETNKYDGHCRRPLLPEEVRQMAGRAGRFGIFDVGYFCGVGGRATREVASLYDVPTRCLSSVPLSPSRALVTVPDMSLSDTLRKWASVDVPRPYRRLSCERMLDLCERVEFLVGKESRCSGEFKSMEYELVTMAFDEGDETMSDIWEGFVAYEVGRAESLPVMPDEDVRSHMVDMQRLELLYKVFDLFYTYARTFGGYDVDDLTTRRDAVSDELLRRLSKQQYEERHCRICGDQLPWNHPFGICDGCHSSQYLYDDWF